MPSCSHMCVYYFSIYLHINIYMYLFIYIYMYACATSQKHRVMFSKNAQNVERMSIAYFAYPDNDVLIETTPVIGLLFNSYSINIIIIGLFCLVSVSCLILLSVQFRTPVIGLQFNSYSINIIIIGLLYELFLPRISQQSHIVKCIVHNSGDRSVVIQFLIIIIVSILIGLFYAFFLAFICILYC